MEEAKKPKLKIIGVDGNAFVLLGCAQQAARKAKWEKEKIDEVMAEATNGDYNHLLATLMEHFEVC